MTRYRERLTNVNVDSYLGRRQYGLWKDLYSSYGDRTGREECIDEIHPGYPKVKRGGPFFLRRSEWELDSTPVNIRINRYYAFEGKMQVRPAYFISDNLPEELDYMYDTTALGAEAYRRYKPGAPEVDSGVFLAEMRDLPLLLHTRLGKLLRRSKFAKAAGSAYLMWEFGWKPLLSDLQGMYTLQQELAKHLDQLKRDNGKPIRRRGPIRTFSESVTSSPVNASCIEPVLESLFYAETPSYTVTTELEELAWFSGRFRYWIPDIGSSEWEARAIRALFGLNPTPDVLWNALPWTWLIDWFSNIGDSISNMSENAAENLVMDYGYMMHSYKLKRTIDATCVLKDAGGNKRVSCSASQTKIMKKRVVASPFGFGLTETDLSVRQSAILAALGLTKWG